MKVLDHGSPGLHVSGHASQEELKLLINICRPRYFIPVHGEYRMLVHHARLAEDPAFFAELVETAFRPEGSDETVDDPYQVARIRAISRVLRSWRRCPGTGPDGTIDAKALAAWVEEARRRLSASGRLRLADGKIGAVLAFAESAEDGSVPPLAVREVLEDADSDAMESGLWSGLYNRRGVTWRCSGRSCMAGAATSTSSLLRRMARPCPLQRSTRSRRRSAPPMRSR